MNLIKSAIGGISNEHITEFAFVTPKRGRIKLLAKIASAAACVAVAVAAVPMIGRTVANLPMFSVSSNIITDCWADPTNENNARVVFDGRVYLFDNDDLSRLPDQLREEYKLVGEVLTVDSENSLTDGFSLGCSVGDPIYMDSEFPGEIYVLTKAFAGETKYFRFTDYKMHEFLEEISPLVRKLFRSVNFNNKWYISTDPFISQLSEEYLLVDTVDLTTLDLYDWLDIGDKIYKNPNNPGEIYVYRYVASPYFEYVFERYIDFETFRNEGKLQFIKPVFGDPYFDV